MRLRFATGEIDDVGHGLRGSPHTNRDDRKHSPVHTEIISPAPCATLAGLRPDTSHNCRYASALTRGTSDNGFIKNKPP